MYPLVTIKEDEPPHFEKAGLNVTQGHPLRRTIPGLIICAGVTRR